MARHVKPSRVLLSRDVQTLRLQLVVSEYKQRIGTRIRNARETKHWTQPQLARALEEVRRQDDPEASNIDASTISRWERGEVEPKGKTKDYLAAVFDVDVSYFLMDEPDKSKTPDLSLAEVRDEFRPDVDGVQQQLDRIETELKAARDDREAIEKLVRRQNRLLRRQTKLIKDLEQLVEQLAPEAVTNLLAQVWRETASRNPPPAGG